MRRSSTEGAVGTVLLFLLFLLLLALALAVLVRANDRALPPLDGLVRYGCSVDRSGQGRKASFILHVWAEHRKGERIERDWAMVYSVRRKRLEALKDCNQWLGAVEKAVPQGERK